MLASSAITSTSGVITSFSCIRCLLPYPVPWTRVVTSRIETPRTPHGAAEGVTHASPTRAPCPLSPQVSCHLGAGRPETSHAPTQTGAAWVGGWWDRGGPPTPGRRLSQNERGVGIWE